MLELSDKLKGVRDKKDINVVVDACTGAELAELGKLKPADVQQRLRKNFHDASKNYEIIEDAVNDDIDGDHLFTYCMYALIVNDINVLDTERLALAIAWLQNEADAQPEYASVVTSLTAIQNVREYTPGHELEFPADCYLNLASAKLSLADLTHANLSYANLPYADMEGADLTGATLIHTTLAHAKLKKAIFAEANMEYVDLSDACLVEANLHSAFLRQANLKKADLRGATLTEAGLISANLERADCRDVKAMRANISKANLAYAIFSNADLTSATLDLACMNHMTLHKATLTRSLIRQSDLSHAVFDGANLGLADLSDSTTVQTQFEGADMSNIKLQRVKLDGSLQKAVLDSADLRNTDLSSLKLNLKGAQLTNPRMDLKTCFLKDRKWMLAKEYKEYEKQKRTQLTSANISYLTTGQLSEKSAFIHALDKFYGMLHEHPDLLLLQKEITRQVERYADEIKLTKPAHVAELKEIISTHRLFDNRTPAEQFVSSFSNFLGLFAIDRDMEDEADKDLLDQVTVMNMTW